MEIELLKNLGVFYPMSQIDQHYIKYCNIIYQIQVTLNHTQPYTHLIVLSQKFIFLTQLAQYVPNQNQLMYVYATPIDFQLKFQILLTEQKNIKSTKIGLSLFRNSEQNNTFYSCNQQSLNLMKIYLSKYINQKGFHSQFKPIKKLGKGNFASVYEVTRIQDGKKFAVKAFSKANTYNTPNGKQSLINQLTIMRDLSHKCQNLISLEAVFQSDNSVYVVLELLEGQTLYQVIKYKNGKLTYDQIQTIMKGLFKGLQTMQARGIMHRDLKPENIMLRYQNNSQQNNYQTVIIDFGLSAYSQNTPYLFFRCGTPGFVAPQIIKSEQNQKYSPACDMFSIGCIFHLLVTGSTIFPGIKYQQVYRNNKMLQFQIKKDLMDKLNPFAMDLLQRLIDSSPETRLNPTQALNSCFFVNYVSSNLKKFDGDDDDEMTGDSKSPISVEY